MDAPSLDTRDWTRQWIKGRIASHVARGTDNPGAIVKSIRTMLTREGMTDADFSAIMDEVNRESVLPFLKTDGMYRPERLERFAALEQLRS